MPTNTYGPAPNYCSRAHRQAAYAQRRRAARNDQSLEADTELYALRRKVHWLEMENQRLREDLHSTTDELLRLQQEVTPASPGLQALLASGPHAASTEATAPPAQRRRWKLSR